MLDALGGVLCIRFEERTFGDNAGIDAWVLPEADPEALLTVPRCDRPCYVVINESQLLPCGESSIIDFYRHHVLPSVISGREINTNEAIGLKALPQSLKNITVLASKGGSPIWAMQEAGGRRHDFVTLPIPELNEGESLFQYFNGGQFLQMLPLLLFLRTLTEDQRWEPPPLQACFMFDDPNLHWRTYGYINFEEMVLNAQRYNYHTSIATIPLDAWFAHMPTASLFKEHPDRLSLLIHGNDHIDKELYRPCSDKECDRILREALWRIAELERRSGLVVSKVMAPPHGACSQQFLEKLGQVGFEAACISKGSLRHYNEKANWLCTIGMGPSNIIKGLTVFPRFRMSRNCQNSILIAALLHQPIIPVGHHHDAAEGLQLLVELSGFINSLGSVRWSGMKRISRSHYSRRYDGRMLWICMFTKHVEIIIPEGINKIIVERVWIKETEYEPLAWRVMGEKLEWTLLGPDETIPALPGEKIEIVSSPLTLLPIDKNSIKKFRIWPVVRRQLTETRDRVAPALRRFSIRSGPRC